MFIELSYSGEGIIQKLILIFAYCFSGCQSTIQKLPPAHAHGPVQMGVGAAGWKTRLGGSGGLVKCL